MMDLDINNAINFIGGLRGYKLENVHFASGSQYHTDTFIHARVLLQNSYYSSRIALLLSKKIEERCKGLQKITLVGYERYSELLLGLITNYLQSLSKGLTVSTCIMADENGMKPVVLGGEPYKDYIIIVPIVSTGSTTRRIQEAYKQKYSDKAEIGHYHVLKVSPHDKKKDLDTLIDFNVAWSELHKCDLCFNNERSKPLFVADKTQLNPVAIFDLPKTKETILLNGKEWLEWQDIIETDGKYRTVSASGIDFKDARFEKSLQFHKDKKFEDFREYSHNTEKFIEENKDVINAWLDKLAGVFSIEPADRIYILSPCHVMTNFSFINLVNNRLFGSSATIIYLEPSKEYWENFKEGYKDTLNPDSESKVKFFFVDDDLVSGNSFFSIYDLFRYATQYNAHLSGSIFLMNKASSSVNERVKRASRQLHSFVSINMPQQYLVSEVVPYDREIHRYERIMERCLYYEPEVVFYQKCKSLKELPENTAHHNRHLEMFYATHVLYDIFSQKGDISKLEFADLFEDCKRRHKGIKDEYAVLKVLTTNSFTMYKPVRDRVFKWVKDKLNTLEKEMGKTYDKDLTWNDERVEELEHLLFMIRRSVIMGNLHIVSKEFFTLLSKVFGRVGNNGVTYSVQTPLSVDNKTALVGFVDCVLRRYVELISSYPAAAVKIKDSLQKVSFTKVDGKQFKQRLLDEAVVVVNDLYSYIMSCGFPVECGNFNDITDFYKKTNRWFRNNPICDSSYFVIADAVAGNKDKTVSDLFKNYLWVKSFIADDLNPDKSNVKKDIVEKKTEQLCRCLKKIVSPNADIGAFFIVTDVLGKHRLVFDEDDKKYSVLGNRFNEPSISDFFSNLWGSITDDSRILIKELRNKKTAPFFQILGNDIRTLHLYRIGRIGESAISGIIGFYTDDANKLRETGRRYMLLLRRDIDSFIEHHHRNEEFIQSVLAEERRKFAYLTGHGRDMMLRLYASNNAVFGHVITTMERLQSLFVGSQFEDEGARRKRLDDYFPQENIDQNCVTKLITELHGMAEMVYHGNVVEWEDTDAEVNEFTGTVKNGSSWRFSGDLLKYICLELIINAKKNRFIMAKDAYNRAYTSEFNGNTLDLSLSVKPNILVITVKGTGPKVDKLTLGKIEANSSIKDKEDISGLDLIIKLIKVYDDRNNIKMNSHSINNVVRYNTVTISLFA